MPSIKLFSFFALSSLAILFCSLGVAPANALSVERHYNGRQIAHQGIAKKKRSDNKKRCQQRPPPASSSSSTPPDYTIPPVDVNLAVPSSTSSSTPLPSPTPYSSGTGKGLVAWALGEDDRLGLILGSRFSSVYTWSPYCPAQLSNFPGVECVPMLHCFDQIAKFEELVVQNYATELVGLNEVNEAGQCPTSKEDAATLWKDHILPKKALGYRLGSHSTSGNPNGITWMKDYLAYCPECEPDFMCVHWYDTNFDKFKAWIEEWHDTFGLNIWISEFTCQNFNGGAQCTTQEIKDFFIAAIAYCEETSWIERWAPFGFMDLDEDGTMSGVNAADELFVNMGHALTPLGNLVVNNNYS